jgi:tRNA threonylcarbamoyladenosine biosynthesis protein TsaB
LVLAVKGERTIAMTILRDNLMLAVDTSTTSMSVALTGSGRLLGEITSTAERNHSIYLIPTIQRLLKEAGVSPKELAAFAVGVGPGSYTGTRIGVTVAKTFAWTHKLTLLGVSTLEALALGGAERAWGQQAMPELDGLAAAGGIELAALHMSAHIPEEQVRYVVPMIDARRGQVFTGLYELRGGAWRCVVPDGIRLMSAWVDQLLDHAAELGDSLSHVAFTGELALHGEQVERFGSSWNGEVAAMPHELLARHIAELGLRQWSAGATSDVHGLVPNYTQLPEAEAKLLACKK